MSDFQTPLPGKRLAVLSLAAAQTVTITVLAGSVLGEALCQALVKTAPTNLPAGYSSASIQQISTAKKPGLLGEVDLIFAGGDPKARLGYFVFGDFSSASEFNRKHLPPFTHGQKLLAFPPMARCVETRDGTGYCDMWIEDRNVIMTAAASKVNGGADALMAFGFNHLKSIAQGAATQSVETAKMAGIAACSLVTQEEVENALRQRVRSPEPDKAGGCSWRGSSGGGVTVQVFETGQNGFDNAKKRSLQSTPLPGIGDDAFDFVSLTGFVQIQLIKNGHFVAITLESPRDPAKLETAKSLATKIAARL